MSLVNSHRRPQSVESHQHNIIGAETFYTDGSDSFRSQKGELVYDNIVLVPSEILYGLLFVGLEDSAIDVLLLPHSSLLGLFLTALGNLLSQRKLLISLSFKISHQIIQGSLL